MPKKKVTKKVKKVKSTKRKKPVAKKRIVKKQVSFKPNLNMNITKSKGINKSKRVVNWILMVLGIFLILLALLGAYPSGDNISATIILIIGILLFWHGYKKIRK